MRRPFAVGVQPLPFGRCRELALDDEARIDALDRHERLIHNATYGEFED